MFLANSKTRGLRSLGQGEPRKAQSDKMGEESDRGAREIPKHECRKCGYKSMRLSNVTRHYRRIHEQLSVKKTCFCGEQFKTKGEFYTHRIKEHPYYSQSNYIAQYIYKIGRVKDPPQQGKNNNESGVKNLNIDDSDDSDPIVSDCYGQSSFESSTDGCTSSEEDVDNGSTSAISLQSKNNDSKNHHNHSAMYNFSPKALNMVVQTNFQNFEDFVPEASNVEEVSENTAVKTVIVPSLSVDFDNTLLLNRTPETSIVYTSSPNSEIIPQNYEDGELPTKQEQTCNTKLLTINLPSIVTTLAEDKSFTILNNYSTTENSKTSDPSLINCDSSEEIECYSIDNHVSSNPFNKGSFVEGNNIKMALKNEIFSNKENNNVIIQNYSATENLNLTRNNLDKLEISRSFYKNLPLKKRALKMEEYTTNILNSNKRLSLSNVTNIRQSDNENETNMVIVPSNHSENLNSNGKIKIICPNRITFGKDYQTFINKINFDAMKYTF